MYTLASLAAELKLSVEKTTERLAALGFAIANPKDTIPDSLSSKLLQVSVDIKSMATPSKKALKSASTQPENSSFAEDVEDQSANDENSEEGGQLTLQDAATIAEVNEVTLQFVEELAISLLDRKYDLLFQQGYQSTQEELAVLRTGSTVAKIVEYNREQQKLDELEAALDAQKYSATNFLSSKGVDLREILDCQKKDQIKRLKTTETKRKAQDKQQAFYSQMLNDINALTKKTTAS